MVKRKRVRNIEAETDDNTNKKSDTNNTNTKRTRSSKKTIEKEIEEKEIEVTPKAKYIRKKVIPAKKNEEVTKVVKKEDTEIEDTDTDVPLIVENTEKTKGYTRKKAIPGKKNIKNLVTRLEKKEAKEDTEDTDNNLGSDNEYDYDSFVVSDNSDDASNNSEEAYLSDNSDEVSEIMGTFLNNQGKDKYMRRFIKYICETDDSVSQQNLDDIVESISQSQDISKTVLHDTLEKYRKGTPSLKDIFGLKIPENEKMELVTLYTVMYNSTIDIGIFFQKRNDLCKKIAEYKNIDYKNNHLEYSMKESQLVKNKKSIPINYEIIDLDTTDDNKRVMLDKYRRLMQEDTDKEKVSEWLKYALKIPYNKYAPSPINKRDGPEKITKYLMDSLEYMNKKLYGMNQVKEQILHIFNDTISNNKISKKTLALIGPPGVGKCVAPNTLVMYYDGHVDYASNIKVNDVLMGDNNNRCMVSSICSGTDNMYAISYCACDKPYEEVLCEEVYKCRECGFPISKYVVNSEHIMVLDRNDTLVEIPIKELINENVSEYRGIRTSVEFGTQAATPELIKNISHAMLDGHIAEMPSLLLYSGKQSRTLFLMYMIKGMQQDEYGNHTLLVKYEQLAMDIVYMSNSLSLAGYYIKTGDKYRIFIRHMEKNHSYYSSNTTTKYGIRIKCVGVSQYCGFTLSNSNGRFLLGDFTVTHNTELARCIADVAGLPFAQISMGGIYDISYIKGQSPAYIGAHIGSIARALYDMGKNNGVIFLDEFDKISNVSSQNGNVSDCMLHILDTSQNNEYEDYYLDGLKIDISKIWFICSLNDDSSLYKALSDRIDKIYIRGYSRKDKVNISRNYILPKLLKDREIDEHNVIIPTSAIIHIITNYTDEHDMGVRELKRKLESVIQMVNMVLNTNGGLIKKVKNFTIPLKVTEELIDEMLVNTKKDSSKYIHMYS
jgi:hypothetical protein